MVSKRSTSPALSWLSLRLSAPRFFGDERKKLVNGLTHARFLGLPQIQGIFGLLERPQGQFLVSPGMEFPSEAPKKLNEDFAERLADFGFPEFDADTDYGSSLRDYLGNPTAGDWFAKLRDVACTVSLYFEGSGTLSDCSPSGIMANQVVCVYSTPDTVPTAPRTQGDDLSRFPLAYKLTTTSTTIPQLHEVMQGAGQTHARVFATHPLLSSIGYGDGRVGPFWAVRPIDSSPTDDSTYVSIRSTVKSMLKSRVKA